MTASSDDPFPITFVLGAGASRPFGLPTGAELKSVLIQRARAIAEVAKKDASKLGEECPDFAGVSYDSLEVFAERLDLSQIPSVDEFLERNKEYLTISRLLIAREIGRLEHKSLGHFRSDARSNWLSTLVGLVPHFIERLGDGSVSVVTFNYDRLLEHFLFLHLRNGWNLPEDECHERIERLPIIHIHGSLGGLRRAPIAEQPRWPEMQNAATSLRFQFEDGLSRMGSVTAAQHAIDRSRHICFIGFGFYQANLDRLDLWREYKPGTYGKALRHEVDSPRHDKAIYATTFGLSGRRLRELNQYFASRGVHSHIQSKQGPVSGEFSISAFLSELPCLAG